MKSPSKYDAKGRLRATTKIIRKGFQESYELDPSDPRQHRTESDTEYQTRFGALIEMSLDDLVKRGFQTETDGLYKITALGREFMKEYGYDSPETETGTTVTMHTNTSAQMDEFLNNRKKAS